MTWSTSTLSLKWSQQYSARMIEIFYRYITPRVSGERWRRKALTSRVQLDAIVSGKVQTIPSVHQDTQQAQTHRWW
jgi:hypothetical protein